jgi:hypothetical protein
MKIYRTVFLSFDLLYENNNLKKFKIHFLYRLKSQEKGIMDCIALSN